MDYLLRRLREMSPRQRADLERRAEVSKGLTTKILCGERDNPRVGTVQPLLDLLQAEDAREHRSP